MSDDARKFHLDNVMRIDPQKRGAAVEWIRQRGLSAASQELIRGLATNDEEWCVGAHFHWGMSMRNALRDAGFGEKELSIDNLDDYYIGLVELAVGVTKEPV